MALGANDISATSNINIQTNACVVLVKTSWNAHITNALEIACADKLKAHGLSVFILEVPGAFELPFAIKHYWDMHKYKDCKPDAFIALGCVIKGDTPHFDYVCKAVTDGILQLNLSLPIPIIFGVLTVDNESQALERIGGKHGHKGTEAAATALKMIALIQSFRQPLKP
jgi:6,7-dimethyl-8-ribityllumazine synthase